MRRTTHAQRGVGLVELMVGLVLGLLVIAAASMMFVGTRQAGRTTDALSRVQESVRTSFEMVARDVREARGNPCDATLVASNVLWEAVAPAWWADWDQALLGFDGAQAFAGAPFGAGVGQRVAGTDAIVVKYVVDLQDLTVLSHDPAAARFTVAPAAHAARVNDVLMVCNNRAGALFRASAVNAVAGTIDHAANGAAPGNCSARLGLPACVAGAPAIDFDPVPIPPSTAASSPGAKIGRLVSVGWYIGHNGRAGSGERSLFRVTPDGPEEVAEGVRDLQIGYLVGGAASYVDASAVLPGAGLASQWTQVDGVRLDFTFESADDRVSTSASAPRLERAVGVNVNLRNRLPTP